MTIKRGGGLYSEGHLWTLSAVKFAGGQMQRHFNALYIKYPLYPKQLNILKTYKSTSALKHLKKETLNKYDLTTDFDYINRD